ncbi:MAG: hypothetical protein V4437_02955 [Patescibacteria group bacterium]
MGNPVMSPEGVHWASKVALLRARKEKEKTGSGKNSTVESFVSVARELNHLALTLRRIVGRAEKIIDESRIAE